MDTIKTWLRTRPEKLYLCPKHANWIRKWLFRIVHDGRFEAFMIACVVLNAIAMMSEHWGASETFLTVTNTVVVVFTAIFVLEAVLKLLGPPFDLVPMLSIARSPLVLPRRLPRYCFRSPNQQAWATWSTFQIAGISWTSSSLSCPL